MPSETPQRTDPPKVPDFHARVEQSIARLKDERARAIFEMAIAALHPSALERELQSSVSDQDPGKDSIRILDLPRQIEVAAVQAATLNWAKLPQFNLLTLGRATTHLAYCAKALGHDVTVAYPRHPAHDRLIDFYRLNHFIQTRATDMPTAKFDAIASGNLAYPSPAAWANFLQTVKGNLAANGELDFFVVRRALPEKNYEPETAFASFERVGAFTSREDSLIKLTKVQADAFASAEAKRADGPALKETAPSPPEASHKAELASTSSNTDDVGSDLGESVKPKRSMAVIAAIVVVALICLGIAAWMVASPR